MQLKITARHVELKESTRLYFSEEMEKVLSCLDNVTKSTLIVEKIKRDYKIEILIHAKNKDFVAHCEDEKLAKAFHDCVQKVVVQLRKHFDKVNSFENISIRKISVDEDM